MKAIMYGAGNIGRGFIGQVFYQSGYETTFIDVNQAFVDKINEDKEYPVYVTRKGKYVKEPVKNIRAISGRDEAAVIAAIAEADIMATARSRAKSFFIFLSSNKKFLIASKGIGA